MHGVPVMYAMYACLFLNISTDARRKSLNVTHYED